MKQAIEPRILLEVNVGTHVISPSYVEKLDLMLSCMGFNGTDGLDPPWKDKLVCPRPSCFIGTGALPLIWTHCTIETLLMGMT